jgi:hypothetical protein
MNLQNKLLYIGAGLHIKPVVHFGQTQQFIFIETKPRSEFDKEGYFYQGFYRARFVPLLLKKCTKYGFDLISEKVLDDEYYKEVLTIRQYEQGAPDYINPTLLTFFNKDTNQTIKYYISTNILYNMNDELEKDLGEADGLIISGYHPHTDLLQYLKPPTDVYGYSRTVYAADFDPHERDTIVQFAHRNVGDSEGTPSSTFAQYFLVDWETGTMRECSDFLDMHKCKSAFSKLYSNN